MMKVFFLVVLWFGLLRCVANRVVALQIVLCVKQRQQRKAEQIRCTATGIQGHAQTTKNEY